MSIPSRGRTQDQRRPQKEGSTWTGRSSPAVGVGRTWTVCGTDPRRWGGGGTAGSWDVFILCWVVVLVVHVLVPHRAISRAESPRKNVLNQQWVYGSVDQKHHRVCRHKIATVPIWDSFRFQPQKDLITESPVNSGLFSAFSSGVVRVLGTAWFRSRAES